MNNLNMNNLNIIEEYKKDRKYMKEHKRPKRTEEEKKERKRLYQQEYMKTYMPKYYKIKKMKLINKINDEKPYNTGDYNTLN